MTESKKRRSVCPVACALDLIGDRWTLLVVRDMLLGRRFFKEFSKSPENIATNILANRLKLLVESGLVETFAPAKRSGGRIGYRLTEKGKSLEPIVDELSRWGLGNLPGTEFRLKPI